MRTPRILLGIDLGTSAVKAGLFTAEGKLLGMGRCAFKVDFPFPGSAQVDTGKWWTSVRTAVGSVCSESAIAASEVDAVGLSVLFPAVVPMNGESGALHPAILYNDQRSIAQVQEIEKKISQAEHEARIGNTLMSGNCAVTSMSWVKGEDRTFSAIPL